MCTIHGGLLFNRRTISARLVIDHSMDGETGSKFFRLTSFPELYTLKGWVLQHMN